MQWNLLTATLTTNALFSGISGVILTVGAKPMSEWLGTPMWISITIGLGLVLFSVQVAMTVRDPQPQTVWMVIAGDVTWVVLAITLLAVFPDAMSSEGVVALAVVTAAVATFALLQWLGLRSVDRVEGSVAARV
jgi:hypothetical protein